MISKFRYYFIRVIGKSFRFLMYYANPLNLIENVFIRKGHKKQTVPIFIIGAPRSGTTLLYQLLAYHYKITYFSNFSSVFIKSPVIISYLVRKLSKPYNDRHMSSNYGLVKGIWSPSEAGKIFKFWFKKRNDDRILNSISKMSSIGNAPFVAKNLRINSDLEYIHSIFPKAVFIHIKRDVIYNAQSLIIGNKKNKTDIVANISDNRERDSINYGSKKERFEQVVQDIVEINESIESFIKQEHVNAIQLDYEQICEDYEVELKKVETKLTSQNVYLNKRNEPFDLVIKSSKEIKLPGKDWEILNSSLQKFQR